MKHLFVILLSLYAQSVFAGHGGYIGSHDNRSYGSLEEPEYNGIVKLTVGRGGRCTGGFVSKNLVLTNDHCAVKCKDGCSAEFWNGSGYEQSNLKVVLYRPEFDAFNGTDWALLLSDKENNNYISVSPSTSPGRVQRGGFGTLRIIADDEIPFLKNLYAQTIKEHPECKTKEGRTDIPCINRIVDKKLKSMGKRPLLGDADNFKVQTCSIVSNMAQSNNMVKTDCDSAGGDSGAPLLRGRVIVGLNNSGNQQIFGKEEVLNANAVKTENFYKYVQSTSKKYEYVTPSITNILEQKPNNNTQPVETPNEDEQKIQQMLEQRLQEFDCD